MAEKPTKMKPKQRARLHIVSGQVHPELAIETAEKLGVEVKGTAHKTFPNTEQYIRYEESVRGKDVYIIQTHAARGDISVDQAIMEQALLIDAAKRASARSITAVAPNLGYARQDRKARGREPISAAVTAYFLGRANRIASFDLHSPQIQGYFDGPYDHLTASPVLCEAMASVMGDGKKSKHIIISPDTGRSRMVSYCGDELGLDTGQIDKRRDRTDSSKIETGRVLGQVAGKTCFLLDDMIDTAGTLVKAAEAVDHERATDIYAFAAHGIFSGEATERILDSPIQRVIVTDTIPQEYNQERLGDKLEVLSVADLLASAITQIQTCGSVSELFHGGNHM